MKLLVKYVSPCTLLPLSFKYAPHHIFLKTPSIYDLRGFHGCEYVNCGLVGGYHHFEGT